MVSKRAGEQVSEGSSRPGTFNAAGALGGHDSLTEAPQAVYGISPLEHPELRDLIEMRDRLNREIARAMMLPACLLEVSQRDGQPVDPAE